MVAYHRLKTSKYPSLYVILNLLSNPIIPFRHTILVSIPTEHSMVWYIQHLPTRCTTSSCTYFKNIFVKIVLRASDGTISFITLEDILCSLKLFFTLKFKYNCNKGCQNTICKFSFWFTSININ